MGEANAVDIDKATGSEKITGVLGDGLGNTEEEIEYDDQKQETMRVSMKHLLLLFIFVKVRLNLLFRLNECILWIK